MYSMNAKKIWDLSLDFITPYRWKQREVKSIRQHLAPKCYLEVGFNHVYFECSMVLLIGFIHLKWCSTGYNSAVTFVLVFCNVALFLFYTSLTSLGGISGKANSLIFNDTQYNISSDSYSSTGMTRKLPNVHTEGTQFSTPWSPWAFTSQSCDAKS